MNTLRYTKVNEGNLRRKKYLKQKNIKTRPYKQSIENLKLDLIEARERIAELEKLLEEVKKISVQQSWSE